MSKLLKVITTSILFSFNITNYSQIHCATDEYNRPFIESNIEKYNQIEENIQSYLSGNELKSNGQIVIPVVFHIVWIDNRQNLSESVILDQLDALNIAFNAKNEDVSIITDTLSNWVGNFNIRFELAHIDPNGEFTSGITRTKTINPHFSYFGDQVKNSHYGKDAWPTDRYLNIWVCNLLEGMKGYSQFPGGDPNTDGIVVDWQTVGNKIYEWTYPDSQSFACGKVLVHEVGHWLNLYHPWGSGSGCEDDFIPETGLQSDPIYPSETCHDTIFGNCSPMERLFVKHYMDYSGCSCMVTFTKNQVKRGLASLHTYRENIITNYIPRPEVNHLSDVLVNPNLTEGEFYIQLPNNTIVTVSIFDMNGKIIEQRHIHEKILNTFNISKNDGGVYFIRISDNTNVITKKIIKI